MYWRLLWVTIVTETDVDMGIKRNGRRFKDPAVVDLNYTRYVGQKIFFWRPV
jgi:hypothetical protein